MEELFRTSGNPAIRELSQQGRILSDLLPFLLFTACITDKMPYPPATILDYEMILRMKIVN